MLPSIAPLDYVARWENEDALRRVGNHTREDVEHELWPWLKQRGFADDGDDTVLLRFLDEFLGNRPAHMRPGLRFRRIWTFAEAAELGSALAETIRSEFDAVFAIAHEPELSSAEIVRLEAREGGSPRAASAHIEGHYAKPAELVARVDAAETATDKGNSLELLMEALFAQVPGFVVYQRNLRTETEEIDLVVVNNSPDPVYSRDGAIILVECKNWTGRPGRPEFSLLESKIRNRHNRCTLGFFISWSGFAETVSSEALRTSRDDYVIVCLTGVDIRQAALVGNFPDFLREATLRALNA
jgi:hypothetical protein